MTGSPEPPPPYKIVNAFPKMTFDHPLLLAHSPELNRIFVGEQAGVLYSFPDKPDAKPDLFIDLRKELKTLHLLPKTKGIDILYGLAFHPRFKENRQCFICYTLNTTESVANFKDGSRISRFTATKTDPPRVDPNSEEVVLSFIQGGHNGRRYPFWPRWHALSLHWRFVRPQSTRSS